MPKNYSHFTAEERDCLQFLHDNKFSQAEIARILCKHKSSVSRELKRNCKNNFYVSREAEMLSVKRRAETKPAPKFNDEKLRAEIFSRFALFHSPEQIAGRLKIDFPLDARFHVSHETIYKIIYAKLAELSKSERDEMKLHLRHGNIKRHKRSNKYKSRGKIPNTVSIDKRPAIADAKTEIGHWEGDTVEGKNKSGYIVTMVDKASKFLFASLSATKQASVVADAIEKMFCKIPLELKKTFTFDNGKEFTLHEKISLRTGAAIFFAHAFHSWERGLNEHTNGLLRQFFPKHVDLKKVSQAELDKAIFLINNRPRKSLGFKTPAEVFFANCIALQTWIGLITKKTHPKTI